MVVVKLGVVVLYAIEEEITRLFEEWIDGKVERFEVWCKRHVGELRIDVESSEARRELQLGLLWGCGGQLVEERGEEVRVVNADWQLGEDVLVTEATLLEAGLCVSIAAESQRLFI